ncbi:MAG TPA: DUF1641 domain-containing protein [Paenalcaligenes sp.]|nr:DUF1641 domain-containing protein [Paenalcaligenes sp.]
MTQSNDNYLSIDKDESLSENLDSLIKDDATLVGLQELIDKLEPLIAGGRLHKLVDIASIAADLVDMSDKYMVEKVAKAGEDLVGGTWAVGNAARMASTQLRGMEQTPSLIGLLRLAREPNVRRGLTFLLLFAAVIGKTHHYQDLDYTAE